MAFLYLTATLWLIEFNSLGEDYAKLSFKTSANLQVVIVTTEVCSGLVLDQKGA